MATRLRRGPLPIDEALRAAVQIANALEAAHDKAVAALFPGRWLRFVYLENVVQW